MEQRNLIVAAVLSIGILLVWQFMFEQPRMEKLKEEQAREQALKKEQAAKSGQSVTQPATPVDGPQSNIPRPSPNAIPQAPNADVRVPGAPAPVVPGQAAAAARNQIVSQGNRVQIRSERLTGSIALRGGRIDDLTLIGYHETVDKTSPQITLLSPIGAPRPYYAQLGWVAGDASVPVPNDRTLWKTDNSELSTNRPVTLSWDNGQGLTFRRTISIDENYMFQIKQSVENSSGKPVTLYPYGLVSRTGVPDTLGFFILHEGLVGVLNGQLTEIDYDDLEEVGKETYKTRGGWLGITDKYWLVALVPDQNTDVQATFSHFKTNNRKKFQTDYLGPGQIVPAGQTGAANMRLFAGAKEVRLLDKYAEENGIARFDLAVDFGWFYFLTKPIFYALEYFNRTLGNFGLGILLLTVLIKIAFFPLANKSYRAMSRMKQLQPKMLKLRERYPNDKQKLNEAMMRLYREEKVNPAAGCLPIMVQIPVFFALYKVLFVSIEMRHAPFYGWIRDLSAPDPTSIFNLFGLIPWTPPEFLLIGVWPLLMGITMWLQQKLNPAPADPMQQKIFMFLPIIFTIMLARFPAGLVIYWAWNNLLSITQQWVIMRRMGVKVGG